MVDSDDAENSPEVWGPLDPFLGISETSTSPCYGATDGYCDTGIILTSFLTSPSAAELCANKNASSTFPGALFSPNWWYLPSICELGSGLYANAGGSTILSCNTAVPTGISSLDGLGYLANLSTQGYWSSTEVSQSVAPSAWIQFFKLGRGGNPYFAQKNTQPSVRCVKGLTY